jgi:hypothetical protein
LKYLSNENKIDETEIHKRAEGIRELYTHKIDIFSQENLVLDKEVSILQKKVDRMREELFSDDLSEMGNSLVKVKNKSIGTLGDDQDLDGYDGMYSDINSMIESMSIKFD